MGVSQLNTGRHPNSNRGYFTTKAAVAEMEKFDKTVINRKQ